jgi:hypothetical protein
MRPLYNQVHPKSFFKFQLAKLFARYKCIRKAALKSNVQIHCSIRTHALYLVCAIVRKYSANLQHIPQAYSEIVQM